MDNDIKIPQFLRNESPSEILQRMIGRLPEDIDVSEGSILYDMLIGIAKEKSRMIEFQLNETVKLIYPQFAYGEYLDRHAEIRSMKRHAARTAGTNLEITGIANTVISKGFKFSTVAMPEASSIEFEATEEIVIGENGKASIPVMAVIPGVSGNAAANTITLMSKPISGIRSITNPIRATGGTAEESEDSLKQRIIEHDASKDVSYCGSLADYRRWAKEVDGVGSAIPVQAQDDSGLVTIILTDANGEPANDTILRDVYNHIMRPDNPDDRLAPVNALISVLPPTVIFVRITARVKLSAGENIEDVTKRFKQNLIAYYNQAIEETAIKYVQVWAVLAKTAGVDDFTDLLINDGMANIPLSKINYPLTESVVFNIA